MSGAALRHGFGFVEDDGFGAQQIRNARWHVADLGADGLGVPFGEQRVVETALRLGDLQAFAQVAGDAFILTEAKEPVERDLVFGSDVDERFGTRQACGRAGEKLGEGRAVYADGAGEGRLVEARALEQGFQALAERAGEIAFVDDNPVHDALNRRLMSFVNN